MTDDKVTNYVILIALIIVVSTLFISSQNSNFTKYSKNNYYCDQVEESKCQDNTGIYTNYCNDKGELVEFYCKNNKCISQIEYCPWSMICQNGECVDETSVKKPVNKEEPKYYVCSQGKCMEIEGSGDNECNLDSDCVHMECLGEKCIKMNSSGEDSCNTNEDCECICNSGVCCDGCHYRSSNYICDSQFEKDFGCPQGTDCGSDIGLRYKIRYCSGENTWCNGKISDWQEWNIYAECNEKQACIDGVAKCKYSPNCI